MSSPLMLLDACVVVNLYASRCMEQILAAIDVPVAIADVVAREVQFVYRGGSGADAKEREVVDLQPVIAIGGLIVMVASEEAELLTFIDLAEELGQGEAMTASLAIHRGCAVVTDDRKATRVLATRGITCRTTLDLIRAWSDGQHITPAELHRVLIDVRQRGNYEPSRTHPLRDWWEYAMTAC